jgi:hypothetical protein
MRRRFLCSGSPKSRDIPHDVIRSFHSTAAIMASSSVRVRTVREQSDSQVS